MDNQYDVIIVGGRIAGASLAMRLSRQNLKVLLIDRATFPSWPAVPSSPIIYPSAMRLLEALGFAEAEYACPEAKVTHVVMDMMGKFQATFSTELMQLDRNYIYGIDRHKFDTVLWERAASLPLVTARDNFGMTDVIKDDNGRITGIVGRAGERAEERLYANLVVGADGRFSQAARKFGSRPFEELNDYPSASFHAEWENVGRYSETMPYPAALFQIGNGYSLLCIPLGNGKYIIANYLRTADVNADGKKAEETYLENLQKVPRLREQLKNARRVTPVVGVRRIDNGYRQAYGDGWALVGDAFHYESPLDGQGIYNALLASQFLADAIAEWQVGKPWLQAGAAYQQRFYDSSIAMLRQTVKRVQQELYTSPPPDFVVNTLLRWMLTDPEYQQQFLRYLARAIDPTTFSFSPTPGPIVRGFWRDVTGRRNGREA